MELQQGGRKIPGAKKFESNPRRRLATRQGPQIDTFVQFAAFL